ncbi:MAG: hypothetical protein ISS70_13770 [Phycisphaerae bacterium]|nr:hypothetical protein [Phycisphaerae bacterium]
MRKELVCCASFLLVLVVTGNISAELVAHWKFDDGAGNTAADSIDNAHPGTIGGTANWVAGQAGGALDFDGSTNYVDIGGDQPVISGTFSLTMWVYARGIPTAAGDLRMPLSNDTWADRAIHVHIWPETSVFRIDTKNGTDISSNTVIQADQWYHVAGTLDAAGESKIYINGVLDNSATGNGREYVIGPANIGAYQESSRFFDGMIDDVRIYSHILSEAEVQETMLGSDAPARPLARRPSPDDGALLTNTWVSLSWSPGDYAVSHDVYIGDSLDDVNDGTEGTFVGNYGTTTLIVGLSGFSIANGLIPGTTYYWRIDEVSDDDPNSPWKGDVWSFSIAPRTAYNPNPADGAEFVDPNATLTWTGGYGSQLHTVYLGESHDDVSNAGGGMPLVSPSYDPDTLEREKVLYWRVDEFDGIETHKGDIWAFTTPGAVGNPAPANGAVDVPMLATLSWTPADTAASSDLYFGADADAVKDATKASPEYIGNRALGLESYDPGKLAFDTTYYWRVDAVYPAETVKGLLWSLATADFIAVDDFESYNGIDPPDSASNRIFDGWIDGFGTTTNGALVGNDLPPYAEQTIVHGGAQSMIYSYDNNLKTSEATLTLVYPRDWTEEGVTRLSLWFRGSSANSAERMFVALNGNAAVYHDDPAVTKKAKWTEWTIDLQAFADQNVNLANVNTITIGFGTKNSPAAGGTGTMYFDDIGLVK